MQLILFWTLQDLVPEADEKFLVNITKVTLLGTTPAPGSEPSIRIPGNVATVTISENDNARGIVQFNVTTVGDMSIYIPITCKANFKGDCCFDNVYSSLLDFLVNSEDSDKNIMTPYITIYNKLEFQINWSFIHTTLQYDNLAHLLSQFLVQFTLSNVIRKPDFCLYMYETKEQINCTSNCTVICYMEACQGTV